MPPSIDLQAQTILYRQNVATVRRTFTALARGIAACRADGAVTQATVSIGDCSPEPCLTSNDVAELRAIGAPACDLDYRFFGENLGHGGGHNRLADGLSSDSLLVMNPDVVVSPRALGSLISVARANPSSIVEAKQLPIEHPKDYDVPTGRTSWASMACSLIPAPAFVALGGFDAASFFMYCDDVDFSWRAKMLGYGVLFDPAAFVFHDKRLSDDGRWQPTDSERFYSAEAALLLAHKWSKPDIVNHHLHYFDRGSDPVEHRAAAAYRAREASGSLPAPRDPGHDVGQFVDGQYASHRFAL